MTVAEFLKIKYPIDAEHREGRTHHEVMGAHHQHESVETGLTLTSGTRVLKLNGDKPIKQGLLRAFIV